MVIREGPAVARRAVPCPAYRRHQRRTLAGHRPPAIPAAPRHRHTHHPCEAATLGKYLGDSTMATTILDRPIHRCMIWLVKDKSFLSIATASPITNGAHAAYDL